MKVMASACLLGKNCKYSGGNNRNEKLLSLLAGHDVIPVCPEVLGGLPVPRIPAEIVDGIVTSREGISMDAEFRRGAAAALDIAKSENVDLIVLQPRSPSCGVGMIYDGSFSGKLIPGNGIFASLALDAGFRVINADELIEKGTLGV